MDYRAPESGNPFAAPQTESEAPPAPAYVFKPLEGRAHVLSITLLIWSALTALWFVGNLIFSDANAENALDEGTPGDMALFALAIGQFLAFVACMVASGFFLPQANRNARVLAEGIQSSPAMAYWSFFIPFVNLYRPYQSVREIWNGSEPHARVPWHFGRPHWSVSTWWGSWLIFNIGSRIEQRMGYEIGLSEIAGLAAAALYWKVTTGIATRQEARRQALAAARATP